MSICSPPSCETLYVSVLLSATLWRDSCCCCCCCCCVYWYVNCSRCRTCVLLRVPWSWETWVQAETLVINYLKKSPKKGRSAFVFVMWSCSSAGMWLRVIYHSAGCWPGFNRALHQSTLSELSIKNTSLLLLFCGRKSGWHNHSPTEPVVRKEKWVSLSPSNQILIRMDFRRPCVFGTETRWVLLLVLALMCRKLLR